MIVEALWARAEESRQLAALRQRLAQETPQADETPGSTDGRPGDALLGFDINEQKSSLGDAQAAGEQRTCHRDSDGNAAQRTEGERGHCFTGCQLSCGVRMS